jgi:hypothetical protein
LATAVTRHARLMGSNIHSMTLVELTSRAAEDPAPPSLWPTEANAWPAGTRVLLYGTIVERSSSGRLRVALDGGAGEIVTAREHIAGPARQPRRARPRHRRPEPTGPGARTATRASKTKRRRAARCRRSRTSLRTPTTITKKRFDFLADRAVAGDWTAVAAYQCNGVNTYAKAVRQYRDRLLAAHTAQRQAAAAIKPAAPMEETAAEAPLRQN